MADERLRELERKAAQGDAEARLRLAHERARQGVGYAQAVVAAEKLEGFTYRAHQTFSCGDQTHEIALFWHDWSRLLFSLIPGGRFQMGGRDRDREQPIHEATVEPFLLSQTACTQAAWDRHGARAGVKDERGFRGDQLPMGGVSWNDVQAWLNTVGYGLRLPSEEEWEYAARGGTHTAYCFGDDPDQLGEYGWFGQKERTTHPVAQLKPNAFGLYDVHGNLDEWCQDEWYYYAQKCAPDDATKEDLEREHRRSLSTDAQGEHGGRVKRGGCWFDFARNCRSASRRRWDPTGRESSFGFRVARSLAPLVVAAPPAEAPVELPTPAPPAPEPLPPPSGPLEALERLAAEGELRPAQVREAQHLFAQYERTVSDLVARQDQAVLDCTVCRRVPDECGDPFPEAVLALIPEQVQGRESRRREVFRCSECDTPYHYVFSSEYIAPKHEDEETLERLTVGRFLAALRREVATRRQGIFIRAAINALRRALEQV
jgi:formylglycine-generating enzyme required for sulfatase activity